MKGIFIIVSMLFLACNSTKVEPVVYKNLEKSDGVVFHNGIPFTGEAIDHYSYMKIKSITNYKDGFLHGAQQYWYSNGQLDSRRIYVQNKKEGHHYGYWDNGYPRFIYHFKNGVFHGEVKEWSYDGKLYRIFHYENGHETGNQKGWNADGSIKLNYDVYAGKRYGLTGLKLCESPEL